MAVHLLSKQPEWTQLYWNQQPILNQCHTLWLNTDHIYRIKMCLYEILTYKCVRLEKCEFKKMRVNDTVRTVTGLISR